MVRTGYFDVALVIARLPCRRVVVARLLGGRELLLGLLVRHLVEALGDALGGAAAVDEDDRRGVVLHELEQPRVDRRPDRALHGVIGLGLGQPRVPAVAAFLRRRVRLGHVLDRDDDLEVEVLRLALVDDGALAAGAGEELADALQRALGGAQADALDGVVARVLSQLVQPLQGQHHVRASLRRRDCVDLVHDHGLDVGQDLASARADHQVKRFGRRDQDVGRRLSHRPALGLRGVAGAKPYRNRRADARQRRPQVALDVVAERLQRRDIDDLDPGTELVGTAREAVDSPEERR